VLGVNWLVAWAAMIALAMRRPGIVAALVRNESHSRTLGLNQRVEALENTNAMLRRRVARLQEIADTRARQIAATSTTFILHDPTLRCNDA
jgi:hypothetical protein